MAHNYDAAEHDELSNSKKVTVVGGSISAAGQVTVTPLQAWPDPKTYIGLVTITGSLAAAAGNITLDPGSQTQIKGNLTLSDSKGFIGLTTTTVGAPLPAGANYIGLVTISGSLSAAAGNITLDPGSKTQIVGNVTLSDSKGYIGLVTAFAVQPNAGDFNTVVFGYDGATQRAIAVGTDGKLQGNVTVNNTSRSITGNLTLSDAKTFIGLTTSTIGAPLPAGANYIGLVTIVGSLAAAAGNITLDAGSRTGIIGNVTIQDGGGSLTVDGSVGVLGNVTLSDSKTFIGLTTTTVGAPLPAGANFIGLVTIVGSLSPAAGNITLDAGSKTQLVGTVTIQDGGGSITIDGNVGVLGNVTLSDSKTYIGLVTATLGNQPALTAGVAAIGFATVFQASAARTITGNVTLSDAKTYIGLVTATLGNQPALTAGAAYVGLASVNIGGTLPALSAGVAAIGFATVFQASSARTITGNLTLSDAKTFIGLVTAVTRNAGTTKTLIGIPVALSTASQATIAVPATNLSIYITSVLFNSDATVRLSIKSGVTYLTGNASIGITLNPGGGWVESGAPDAPIYISTPSASINIEKFDMTATKANVGGKLVYFTE